uniref:Uncharacterized protein n=1 Tax=Anopheles coluzzii TaxID=1518534 RepID=A0A8W7NZJ6_ANOCL
MSQKKAPLQLRQPGENVPARDGRQQLSVLRVRWHVNEQRTPAGTARPPIVLPAQVANVQRLVRPDLLPSRRPAQFVRTPQRRFEYGRVRFFHPRLVAGHHKVDDPGRPRCNAIVAQYDLQPGIEVGHDAERAGGSGRLAQLGQQLVHAGPLPPADPPPVVRVVVDQLLRDGAQERRRDGLMAVGAGGRGVHYHALDQRAPPPAPAFLAAGRSAALGPEVRVLLLHRPEAAPERGANLVLAQRKPEPRLQHRVDDVGVVPLRADRVLQQRVGHIERDQPEPGQIVPNWGVE